MVFFVARRRTLKFLLRLFGVWPPFALVYVANGGALWYNAGMRTKTFEVRDRATALAMIAIKLNPLTEEDRLVLARAGYGADSEHQARYVLFGRADGGQFEFDPFAWGDRTIHTAHRFIIQNFDALESGAVVDVEYLRGEAEAPCASDLAREEAMAI